MDLGKTQKASGMSHHPNATGDSWEEVRIVTLIGVWKSFIPTLTDDIKEFKTSAEEVTAYGVETERELELEVGPGDFPVVQRLRICLAMQGTWVRSLVGELISQSQGN